jgi:hypothetical protein
VGREGDKHQKVTEIAPTAAQSGKFKSNDGSNACAVSHIYQCTTVQDRTGTAVNATVHFEVSVHQHRVLSLLGNAGYRVSPNV